MLVLQQPLTAGLRLKPLVAVTKHRTAAAAVVVAAAADAALICEVPSCSNRRTEDGRHVQDER